MAGVMNQVHIREVIFTPAFLGHHMMDVESLALFQVWVTGRAAAGLPPDEWPTTIFGRLRLGSSVSPVVLQGRVIRGIGFPEASEKFCTLDDIFFVTKN
jgi:hypothetical protein